MDVIEVGSEAPDFELPDQDKTMHKLSSYQGKPVVLFFYPLDFSSVCSEEMSCIMDNMERFNELDAQLFGISVDSVYSHRAFAEQRGIEYPLLADFHPKGKITRQFGFYVDTRGHGTRGYVVIDGAGKVVAAKETGPATIPDMDEVAAAVAQAKG